MTVTKSKKKQKNLDKQKTGEKLQKDRRSCKPTTVTITVVKKRKKKSFEEEEKDKF